MKRILAFMLTVLCVVSLSGCKANEYSNAKKLASDGNYEAAITAYTALGDYKESKAHVEILKIVSLAKRYEKIGENFGPLGISNYEGEVGDLETLANETRAYAKTFDSTVVANDAELSEYVQELDLYAYKFLQLMEIDRDSIDQFFGPEFFMFPSTMELSLQESERMYNSWFKEIGELRLPSKYDDWY